MQDSEKVRDLVSMGFNKDLAELVVDNCGSDTPMHELVTVLQDMGLQDVSMKFFYSFCRSFPSSLPHFLRAMALVLHTPRMDLTPPPLVGWAGRRITEMKST